jgi:hypothetical protein
VRFDVDSGMAAAPGEHENRAAVRFVAYFPQRADDGRRKRADVRLVLLDACRRFAPNAGFKVEVLAAHRQGFAASATRQKQNLENRARLLIQVSLNRGEQGVEFAGGQKSFAIVFAIPFEPGRWILGYPLSADISG